ncbi:MAG: hypothetical protein ACRCTQ_02840 [Brevinemataceae bacterium]
MYKASRSLPLIFYLLSTYYQFWKIDTQHYPEIAFFIVKPDWGELHIHWLFH